MNIFSILVALLLEPYRPKRIQARVLGAFDRYAMGLDDLLNSGERHHGIAAWALAVLPVLCVAGTAYVLLGHLGMGLGWILNVLVLLFLLEFRPILDKLSEVQHELRQEPREVAAQRLGFAEAPAVELSQLVAYSIERSVMDIHARLFAVLFWYCLLPGPLGALLYVMARRLSQLWGADGQTDFGHFSQEAYFWLDWIPLRLTAFAFAIVGNFEDSLFCWRTQAVGYRASLRIILASAAGALGIRLADATAPQRVLATLELGVGEYPDLDHLRSAEGMIWRTLVLWLLVISLLTIAAAVGN